jgi:hypothetical protein
MTEILLMHNLLQRAFWFAFNERYQAVYGAIGTGAFIG